MNTCTLRSDDPSSAFTVSEEKYYYMNMYYCINMYYCMNMYLYTCIEILGTVPAMSQMTECREYNTTASDKLKPSSAFTGLESSEEKYDIYVRLYS